MTTAMRAGNLENGDKAVGDGRDQRICVLVPTMLRPQMLAHLLMSFSELVLPPGCDVTFCVLDNDARQSAKPVFESFRSFFGEGRLLYVCEPVPGIPIVRNRGLAEAMAIGADFAAFVDDDETVDRNWLAELVECQRHRALELVGGPVRAMEWKRSCGRGWWRGMMLNGVRSRYAKKEKRAGKLAEAGRDEAIVIVTNNWMIDLAWLEKSDVRFDESLQFSGGSDALFYKHAKAEGIRSGWCSGAIVYEAIPASRLTARYQFERARSQAITNFERRHSRDSGWSRLAVVSSCAIKSVAAIGCFVAIPVIGGPAVIQFVRTSGWVVGRLGALWGGRSRHYETVHGA